jgi:hypothetical protein
MNPAANRGVPIYTRIVRGIALFVRDDTARHSAPT